MKYRNAIWRAGALVAVCCLALHGCQSGPPVPVVERGQPPPDRVLHHIASSGETLYSVAWKYELDFQQLAQINGLQPPYSLRPGQRLSLDVAGGRSAAPPPSAPVAGVRVTPLPSGGLEVQDVTPPVASPAPSSPPMAEAPPPSPTVAAAPPLPVPSAATGDWQWPVKGQVSREFDANNALKGISIATDARAPVMAAAPGVVVYAGDGLRGYGKLIIVKHSDTQLSAYAHNHQILVAENQAVKQGQQIAEVGSDNAGKHRLYFEIRENGKPVDPLARLPK